ncbi:hypothetical protein FOPG_18613 [Fusarium oxysporum f. sp. conglutinans race 2 54008]|uniref:Uncharacterized protein n=1 Tax=Fusarium oxysporum f. sp. conglutinans race 2 54008 TaxID=1089457 RepID=X0GNC4_FUSOX|nr:hypothetical protein FOPG_18613 [Fusarium oxysporum f. sp. conglutinans race 2 54008]
MAYLPIRAKVGPVETDCILGQGELEGDADIINPRKDEEKIICFLTAVNAMLDRHELPAQTTSRALLCWLASSRLDTCQVKPFALEVEQYTWKRYRLLWKRLIAFMLQAYLLPDIDIASSDLYVATSTSDNLPLLCISDRVHSQDAECRVHSRPSIAGSDHVHEVSTRH